MNKRTKACAISPKVKERVYRRDGGLCIFCRRPGLPEAHIVSRAQGGLGIEENVVTVCRDCHRKMDQTTLRPKMIAKAKEYVIRYYGSWSEYECTYHKWSLL